MRWLKIPPHLSGVEGLHLLPLHEEHVDKVYENAWRITGVFSRERQPLVKYHEHQVTEQTQQEQELRQKDQVKVVLLLKVAVQMRQKKGY